MKIQSSFWKPRLPYLLGGIIAVPIIIVIAGYIIFTTVAFIDGGFTPREVYFFTSPDNLSRVVIAKRTAFPASEFVDPAIVVTIELREVSTDIILGMKEIRLTEESDLNEPTVQWKEDTLQIDGLDSRTRRTIILKSKND